MLKYNGLTEKTIIYSLLIWHLLNGLVLLLSWNSLTLNHFRLLIHVRGYHLWLLINATFTLNFILFFILENLIILFLFKKKKKNLDNLFIQRKKIFIDGNYI